MFNLQEEAALQNPAVPLVLITREAFDFGC